MHLLARCLVEKLHSCVWCAPVKNGLGGSSVHPSVIRRPKNKSTSEGAMKQFIATGVRMKCLLVVQHRYD